MKGFLMNLFSFLPENEINLIEQYIDRYARTYDYYFDRRAHISTILQEWSEQKSRIFQLFNNNFIIKQKVSFQKDKNELISDLIGSEINGVFKRELKQAVRCSSSYYDILFLFDENFLINNKYMGNSFSVEMPDGTLLKVNRGCKISKVLGKIAKGFNVKYYEEWRIAISQILNQKQLSGTLCLSIHPLDYMTMSDNDCNWDSCMNWRDVGDYRRGTIEMMNSPSVIVAYLESSSPFYPLGDERTWSNKKWRKLFIATDDFITGIKGYPYENDDLTITTISILKDLAEKNWGVSYWENWIRYPYDEFFQLPNDKNIKIVFYTDAMYNDFNSYHYGYFSKELDDNIFYNFSGASVCLSCGAIDASYEETYDLVCSNCCPSYTCESCGERVGRENLIDIDDTLICQDCYNEFVATDAVTGEEHLIDNLYKIFIVDSEGYSDKYIFTDMDHPMFKSLDISSKIKRKEEYWSYELYLYEDDIPEKEKYIYDYANFLFRQEKII